MSFDLTSVANHLDATTAPVLAPPFTVGGMFKTTAAQGRRLITLYNRGLLTEFMALIYDITGPSGKVAAYVGSGSTQPQQVLGAAAPANAWFGVDVCFESNFTRSVMSQGGNKATNTGVFSPAGINGVIYSGRPGDHLNNVGGLSAHGYIYGRKLEDVERSYLELGGSRRAIKGLLVDWKMNRQSAGVVPDELGLCNLTITGTMAAGADDPAMASWYLGPAIGAQVYQSGTAITPLAIGANGNNVNSPFAVSLMRSGASTASTTALAPIATATRVVPVANVAIFASGDYASVGAAAKSRVLHALATTAPAGAIVLAEDQSFAAGATVARYPAGTVALSGCTLDSNGRWNGIPSGTQALTPDYFFGLINSAQPGNALLRSDTNQFPITVNAMPVAPVFSIPPTAVVRSDGTGYDAPFAPNTACTAYAGAYPSLAGGGVDPTISQLKAGTGARIATNKAVTGADSVSLVGLDPPLSDLHFVLSNGLGDSALFSLRNQLKGPPTGTIYRTFVGPTDPDTIYLGQVSAGDVEEAGATLSPSGAPVTYAPDGNDNFTAAGRQRRVGRIWDASANAWMLDSTGAQQFNVWYNDTPPVFAGGPSVLLVIPLGAPMTPVALPPLFTSQDGAQQKVTALDALPAGLAINPSTSALGGTATAGGIFIGLRIRSTDLAGGTGDGRISAIVGPLHPPNLFSLDYRDASSIILAAFLLPDVNFEDSPGPPNVVLSQDPPSTASVQPFSKVRINVSRTPAGQLPTYGLLNHSFAVTPQADGDLDLNHPDGSG